MFSILMLSDGDSAGGIDCRWHSRRGLTLADVLVAVFSATVLLSLATPFARHTGKVLLQTAPNPIRDSLSKSLSEVNLIYIPLLLALQAAGRKQMTWCAFWSGGHL